MSAQELADLESLYADGVLDEDEYKTKLAELQPAKERTRADELADLEALKNDGILDEDEYRAKLKELQDDDARADALIAYTKSVPVRSHLHRLRAMPDCHPTPLPLPRSS